MKKITAVVMVLSLIISFAGCAKKDKKPSGKEGGEVSTGITENNKTEKTVSDISEDIEWGKRGYHTASDKDDNSAAFYLNYPSLVGYNEHTGYFGEQTDDTLVIVDRELSFSPDVKDNKIENVLSSYKNQTIDIIKSFFVYDCTNFDIVIKNQKTVKIKDYNMCQYDGTVEFNHNGEKTELYFAAYSTQLMSNGAFVYWMVIDNSEDQSLSKTVDENAFKMSQTLTEE